MRQRRNPQGCRGFTLTELAIVLGVIGTITGAIWWATANTREAQKDNDAFIELQLVTQGIGTLKSGQSWSAPYYPAGGSNNTGNMITAQVITGTYVKSATAANNPWSTGNFYVWALTNKTHRLSFYQVTYEGCLSLLLQATACQSGQSGCPFQVGTGGNSTPTAPTQTLTPNNVTGWQTVMGATAANTLCAVNSYTGGNNSVEFDYSL